MPGLGSLLARLLMILKLRKECAFSYSFERGRQRQTAAYFTM